MRDFAAHHSSKVTLSSDQKYELKEFSRAIFGDLAIIYQNSVAFFLKIWLKSLIIFFLFEKEIIIIPMRTKLNSSISTI